MYHIPVLLKESIEGLNIRPEGTYVDVTFGGGGHSLRILDFITTGRLIAFDRDKDTEANLIADRRFHYIQQNYRYLKNFLKFHGISEIDGLLADLGISSWQIDQPGRGFSTRSDGALDMRMDQDQELTAAQIINSYSEEQLAVIFRNYGEISNSRPLAALLIRERTKNRFNTTSELTKVVSRIAPRNKENQYLAKVFQAIRIEVNDELESLKDLLSNATDLLKPGGRIVVISYHSLEDRLVKNYLRSGNFGGIPQKDFFGKQITPLTLINRKAITPSEPEINANPRSRSAKLRIAEKN